MSKKTVNGFTMTFRFLDWFLIIYLVISNFIPQLLTHVVYFFQPFMGVFFVIYSIVATLIVILGIIGLIAIYTMTYTKKLDPKKEPTVPDYVPIWKSFFAMAKNATIVYLATISGLGYIAIVTSIMMMYGIFYFFVQRDFFAKMTKLKLAYKEE